MRGWLKEMRINKGYKTCKDAASVIGISPSHYTSIENGSRKPSIDVAKKIAKIFAFEWTKFYEA